MKNAENLPMIFNSSGYRTEPKFIQNESLEQKRDFSPLKKWNAGRETLFIPFA